LHEFPAQNSQQFTGRAMTIRNLDHLLAPASVALIGASPQVGSVGYTVARNLTSCGFKGDIVFVNPKYSEVNGLKCYPNVAALPKMPALAIVATPPKTVPGLISDLAKAGTRAAVVITAGLGDLKQPMLDASRPSCLRLLGPNSLGLMLPGIGLNASFAHRAAPKGDLAFLSQSGALITAVVDWAASRSIGFSHVISLGDMADVDFGDLLDYHAGDTQSRAILIYMESLTNAPKFISAARRAARAKPVIVVKSGRHDAGAKAAMSHTGALAGSDAAYDAAFRRTGLLRVKTLPELFAAAEMLARNPRLSGESLTILTNGGGAGVLAADELQDAGGTVAGLSPELRGKLDQVLPSGWSHANPIDIIGDAGPERYRAALSEVLADENSNAILVMQCPTALASSIENAAVVVEAAQSMVNGAVATKPLLTCWLGDEAARDSRDLFARHAIPTFETPSDAITGFMQLVRHARSQTELMQAPDGGEAAEPTKPCQTTRYIQQAALAGRTVLTAVEAKAILAAEGIPVAETLIAKNPLEVRDCAQKLLADHGLCVVKILSPDISHKSDVGGVRLGIASAAAAEIAAQDTLSRVARLVPNARIDGFMVEPMIERSGAQEIIVGMSEDETFGPMLLFGAGGTAVEVIADRALALPPIDALLARQLIKETRISRLLAGYRDRPPANMDALTDVLIRVSHLVVRHPEIRELDINPLLVDEKGVIALDARIRVDGPNLSRRRPLAIRPYPVEWESSLDFPEIGRIQIRPVRPDDEFRYGTFFSKVSPDDVRLRFFTPHVHLSHRFLARLTQIDYAREMAFVAIAKSSDDILGVVRLILDPDLQRGEYGIIVRSDIKGHGLGWQLMKHLIDYARHEGVAEITGLVLAENGTMINMVRQLGFRVVSNPADPTVLNVTLSFNSPHQAATQDLAGELPVSN
jgi:acetyltransferase